MPNYGLCLKAHSMGKLSLRTDHTSLTKLWWREPPPSAKHTLNIFGLLHQTVKSEVY